ncbi:MAG: nucleotide exchange factor GrpE [Candidatus Taylorbacteria bacterium]|nr:nucleotide exchange factor GrpE [Candidatus Taylorbacteria bacterium]
MTRKHEENKDDVTIDSSEFEPKKKIKAEAEEASDVIADGTEETRDLSPEAFKRLRERLDVALKEKQEYLDGWQRMKADFANAKKRWEESISEYRKIANEGLIEELLPVLQSFQMAFSNKEAWEKADKNWRAGVEYIYGQLKGTLEQNGLAEVDPTGKKFDPNLHEAVRYEPVEDASKDHVVLSVVEKGYTLGGKLVKPAKVVVAEIKSK